MPKTTAAAGRDEREAPLAVVEPVDRPLGGAAGGRVATGRRAASGPVGPPRVPSGSPAGAVLVVGLGHRRERLSGASHRPNSAGSGHAGDFDRRRPDQASGRPGGARRSPAGGISHQAVADPLVRPTQRDRRTWLAERSGNGAGLVDRRARGGGPGRTAAEPPGRVRPAGPRPIGADQAEAERTAPAQVHPAVAGPAPSVRPSRHRADPRTGRGRGPRSATAWVTRSSAAGGDRSGPVGDAGGGRSGSRRAPDCARRRRGLGQLDDDAGGLLRDGGTPPSTRDR